MARCRCPHLGCQNRRIESTSWQGVAVHTWGVGTEQNNRIYIMARCRCTCLQMSLTKNCVFRKKYHQNGHSILFRNTLANVSQHLWNNSSGQILQENHRAIYLTDSAQLRMLFLPITLDSNHLTTVLQTSEFTQVSPFLSTVMKGHFSRDAFLNVWKCLLFTGDGFAGVRSIDLAMLSLEHKTFLQMVLWFQRSIQLAASRMQWSFLETFFCFVSFAHVQSTTKSKSAYICCLPMHTASKSGFGKFPHKSFGYSRKNWKAPVCLLLFFHEWENP